MFSHSVVSNSLQHHELKHTRLLCPLRLSRQEYWSGLPCPPRGDLPNPGIKPRSHALQADSLPFKPPGKHITGMQIKNTNHFTRTRMAKIEKQQTIKSAGNDIKIFKFSYIAMGILKWYRHFGNLLVF